jgi:hypothetical protein
MVFTNPAVHIGTNRRSKINAKNKAAKIHAETAYREFSLNALYRNISFLGRNHPSACGSAKRKK